MPTRSRKTYDENFKQSLVSLSQKGTSRSEICRQYKILPSTLSKWIKQYATITLVDGETLTARQVSELLQHSKQLEEENAILKKAAAIFTPHSVSD